MGNCHLSTSPIPAMCPLWPAATEAFLLLPAAAQAVIVTLLGRHRGQGERSSSPILRLHWRIRKNGILPWSHPLPVPCPSRKAGNRSPLWLPVSHLCAAARSTRAHSSARFKSPGTASGAAGTQLIILIGLWGSPVFSHIMSLYNLNQD